MKIKKLGQFLKKYGFYVAVSIISVGALVAIFVLPGQEGNVKKEANPYAKNEKTDGMLQGDLPNNVIIDEEDELDQTDKVTQNEATVKENETTASEEVTNNTTTNKVEKDEVKPEVKTETFESTTASVTEEPFFADGDTFSWPVAGKVVVPYTDETTKHWFSESLNQTMRTFGICIAANENTEVKAVAKGTIVKIVDDSSSILESGMPYVGKTMVIDHGNGYVSVYGFQGGTVNEDLLGQVVNEGDVLGTIGTPKGAFINVGDNLYLQVKHNDKVVSPMDFLKDSEETADVKTDSVDVGFATK